MVRNVIGARNRYPRDRRLGFVAAAIAQISMFGLLASACGSSPTGPVRCGFTNLSITCRPSTDALRCSAIENNQCRSSDVTTQAQWQSSDPSVVVISSPGSAKSVSPGDAQITASYAFMTASTRVRVLSGQPPLLVGDILGFVRRSPTCGTNDGIPGVLITIMSGLNSGLQATTEDRGQYGFRNIAFAPTVSLRASKAGYREVVVNGEAGYPPGIPVICMAQAQ
jgi:hypothetical protein